jgi:hypothetical protein
VPRLVVISESLDAQRFQELDGSSNLLVVTPAALGSFRGELLEAVTRRRSILLIAGGGELAGEPLAAALFADWFVLEERASIDPFGCSEAIAGMIWRIGRSTVSFQMARAFPMNAVVAATTGICDEVVRSGTDWVKWSGDWLGDRSLVALEAAARLTRLRGRDALERAEFARLFAAGEPQKGLEAFLGKRRPDFS